MTNEQVNFDQIEQEVGAGQPAPMPAEEAITQQNVENNPVPQQEINLDDLSDKPAGIKYVREDLNGKETTIKSAKLFPAKTNEDPKVSMNGKSKYYTNNLEITYNLQNSDGVDHREYYSGVRSFVQDDGKLSEPSLWYPGATHQVAKLWEAAAAFRKVEPKDVSPKQFMAFLQSNPKVRLEATPVKNPTDGSTVNKNMIKEFI